MRLGPDSLDQRLSGLRRHRPGAGRPCRRSLVSGTASELNDLLAAGELDVSVVSAVEYARNAAGVSPAAGSRHQLRRPGAQRRALLPQAGGRAGRPHGAAHRPRPAPRCSCSSCSAAIAGRSTPRFATVRAEATDLAALAGFPHEAVLVIGDAALHAGGPPRRIRSGWTWAPHGRSGPGCPSSLRCGPPAATPPAPEVQRVHERLLESRRWGLAHLDRAGRRRGRATGVSGAGLPRLPRRPGLRAVVPPPRRAHRFLPPPGAGWPGAGWVALVYLGRVSDCHDMTVVDRTSSEFSELSRALRAAELARAGPAGRCRAVAAPPRARGHLHHRPEHQLHQRLRGRLRFLRVLSASQARRRLRAALRGDRPQDRRVQGHRRRADPAAGRAQPVHPVRAGIST